MYVHRNSIYLLQIETIYGDYLKAIKKLIKFDLKSKR